MFNKNDLTPEELMLINFATKDTFDAAPAFRKVMGRDLTLADLDSFNDEFVNELYEASK